MIRLICVLLLALCASVAAANDPNLNREVFDEWTRTADRAETIIDQGRASDAALEKLRAEIAEFRQVFASARDQNSARIKTLQSQIDALGPKPEEGAEEPADIAELRQSLNSQLADLRVPRVVAEESHNRANGLIGEIDRIIRERQAKELLLRGPSPLNPAHWPVALRDVNEAIRGLYNETRIAWKSGVATGELKAHWPGASVLMLVGVVLMAMGGRWSRRLRAFLRQFGGVGSGVWTFVASLISIVLPMIGLLAFCKGMTMTGLLGLRGMLLLEAIPGWGVTFLFFRWLAERVYRDAGDDRVEFVKQHHRAESLLLVMMLAVMLIADDLIQLYQRMENISDASRAVVVFPPILLSALILLRLQRIGMRFKTAAPEDGEDGPQQRIGLPKLVNALRRGAVVMAVLSPLLAAAGFVNAGEAIVYPAIETLALVSVAVTLQRFFGDLYGWLSGRGEAARDSLLIVLLGFVLALLALPVLALIWGARVSDLTELWDQFLSGFSLGGVQISPTNFLTFALIFSIGFGLTRLLQGGLRHSLLPKTAIDPGGQNAIVAGIGYVGVFLAALVAVTGAGIDLSSLAIVAGALSVGIGFGLQTIVSNFVSGIILLVERPISKGDWIEVGGLMGYVRDISVRSTRIETFDRSDVIVPNSDLISGTVTNYTRGNTIGRVIAPVGVAYGTDTRKVEKILGEIANDHPMVLANPAPSVVFQGFGADSLNFEIRAILRDVNWVLSVKSDLNHEIARRFVEAGIEIPFAQRDIWLRNPEALPKIQDADDMTTQTDPDGATTPGRGTGQGTGGTQAEKS
ncbi:DUF3772 domain-containing protein [Sedimentitalea sp. HM32M-2]